MLNALPDEVEKITVAAPTRPPPKSRPKSKVVESSDEEEQNEPEDPEDSMYVDDEPAEVKPKKPRKKVEKKVVPVGRNGLKKKRIVKSRMSLDGKGYMGADQCLYARLGGPILNVLPQLPRTTLRTSPLTKRNPKSLKSQKRS